MFKLNKKMNRGMTYVELIVVLAIFATLSTVAIFNYGGFQAKVDIKNLASDIALQIVQAQKSSLNGLLPTLAGYDSTWKPSYGVYLNSSISNDADGIAFNKKFIYFADLGTSVSPQNGLFDGLTSCTGECLNKITITKGNKISKLEVFPAGCPAITNLSIIFKRPNSGVTMTSNSLPIPCTISYAQITIASPNSGSTALIQLYPSGRVQVN